MCVILWIVSQVKNLQVCDTIPYFQSVDLDRGELPLSSTEWDQTVIQSLRTQRDR